MNPEKCKKKKKEYIMTKLDLFQEINIVWMFEFNVWKWKFEK